MECFDKTYSIGDKVSYYGKLYESVDNNKTNNPRTYELSAKWISEQYYELTSIVEYENVLYMRPHLR
jgi:chitodextrinase